METEDAAHLDRTSLHHRRLNDLTLFFLQLCQLELVDAVRNLLSGDVDVFTELVGSCAGGSRSACVQEERESN
jgi:hypothetical protein